MNGKINIILKNKNIDEIKAVIQDVKPSVDNAGGQIIIYVEGEI